MSPHLRGHLLLFDPAPPVAFGAGAGARLFAAAVLLEAVRWGLAGRLQPAASRWLLPPILLGCALVSIRLVAGLRFAGIGLRRWRVWTAIEKSYFLQVLVIANVVFPIVLAAPLRNSLQRSSTMGILWGVFVPYLLFGFYQEVVYRGMVQLELIRRWGAPAGVLAANLLYTFGPLHSCYFAARPSLAVPMFASIFVIGLFFGVLFRRSGNLWIVAVFHAIGNAYIVGSLGVGRPQ